MTTHTLVSGYITGVSASCLTWLLSRVFDKEPIYFREVCVYVFKALLFPLYPLIILYVSLWDWYLDDK